MACSKKSCPNDDFDLISNLPLELKQQILARLPIQESVRTSVLSSRWRRVWTLIPQLLLNQQSLLIEESDATSAERFIQIVDKVLSQHKPPISVFNLFALEFRKEALDRWINELCNHPIEEFYIKALGGPQYNLCSELCMFHKLKEMRLINCTINLPESFKGFKLLKFLSLKFCSVKEDELEKLVSSCPSLESLELCNLRPMVSLNINSKKLVTLRISTEFKNIHLKTPFLVEVCIVSYRLGILANVDMFDNLGRLLDFVNRRLRLFNEPQESLAEGLNNLKSLSIMTDFGDKNKSAQALSLFKNALNLKFLLLWVKGEVITESNDVMVKFWESAKFSFEHVKFVSVFNASHEAKGVLCSKPVLAFMKQLLGCSTELEWVNCVSSNNSNDVEMFAHELRQFKMAARGVCIRTECYP
ncbi:hypothetical protein LUZ60_006421 [Juncus effusus]|nr:hypothetical protein LUZ60_006421 [Juncus effusus]